MLIFLNDNILDIEKPQGICSPTFVVDDFSGLFLHVSVFYQGIEIYIKIKSCFISFLSVFKRHHSSAKVFIFT